jgi:cytoskeletal protein CcmA (bactofilin family)
MWGQKKPDMPQAAALEPKNLLTNKKGSDAIRPSDATAERATGWLGSSLQVKGEISGSEDLLIEGSVEGLIQLHDRKLTVGTTAKVTADINARDVVVYGYVKGDVRATGKIEIRKDGSMIGNLTTAQILIEDGADFRGSIEIDRSTRTETDKNVLLRAASAAAGGGPKSI